MAKEEESKPLLENTLENDQNTQIETPLPQQPEEQVNHVQENEKEKKKERNITNTNIEVSFDELYESHIKLIENKTKIDRKYIYTILLISLLFFFIRHFELFFTYLLTGVYPFIWTIQDYKSKKEDFSKMWGSYWIVFMIFVILDFLHKFFIFYVPFYFIIRTSILLVLYLPCFRGAIAFYEVFIVAILKFFRKPKYDEKNSMLTEFKTKYKTKKE